MLKKKGGTVCLVRGCPSRTGGETSLFSIPRDPVRAKCWLESCNREDLLNKSTDALHHNFKVCEKHFELQYISKSDTRKMLFQNAVPTLFPIGFKHSTQSEVHDVEKPSEKVIVPSGNAGTSHEDDVHVSVHVEFESLLPSVPPEDMLDLEEMSEDDVDSVTPCNNEMNLSSTSSISTQTSATMSSGTPRKLKLRRKIKAMRRRKLMESSQNPVKNWTIENFCEMCDTFLGEPLAGIVKAQAKLKDIKPSGRRYSLEYKQFALTLYFLGPRAYFFMQKILCLPSKRCLENMTQKLTFRPGFQNEAIFRALEIKSHTMLEQDKHCIICIDEISLKGNLYYHTGRDEIVGLHDIGNGTKEALIAQNACVIMVRGLYNKWKQQIAYFFVNTQFCAKELCSVMHECVTRLSTAGFHVDGLVSDMGSNFVQLSNILGVTPTNPVFKAGNKELLYLFDTCHLIKATRNNLMQNIFHFKDRKTSWSYIDMFFQKDRTQTYRCAPKLTSSHICPTNFEKMKVKYATQVLSNTVASGMNTYVSLGALPADAMTTIEVIEKFDKLFDLLNSSEKNHPNKYKNVFEGEKFQIEYLEGMKQFLLDLRILNKNGEDVTSRSKFRNCWIVTINSILKLWQKLSEAEYKYLKTRRVNQDVIENFFGTIRQQGGNCINPTPIQFERAFRKLFCQNFLHTNNMNCDDDLGSLLTKINSNNIIATNEESETPEEKSITLPDYDYRHESMPMQNAFNYVCGYLIKKSLNIHSCEVCEKYSREASDLDFNRLLNYFKAYENEESIFGGLRSPSENFVNYIYKLENIFVNKFDEISKKKQISHLYLEEMVKVTYVHPCSEFPKLYVMKLFIRLKIFYTLKFSNKELKGDKGKLKRHRKLTILSHI